MQNAILRYKSSDGGYEDHQLVNQVTTLGRSNSNDIVINDTSISRLHVRVENRGGQYYLVDNNSSNGTFLNRRKVTEAPLKDGDNIMAGRIHLDFIQKQEVNEAEKTQTLAVMGENDPAAASTLNLNLKQQPETTNTVSEGPVAPPLPFVEPEEPAMAPPPLPKPPPAPMPTPPIADDGPDHEPMPIPVPTAPPPPMAPAPVGQTPQTTVRAKPVKRLLAYLLDSLTCVVLMIPYFLLSILLKGGFIALFLGFVSSVACALHVVYGWHKYGKTVGKHLMKIRVIETGKPEKVGLEPKTVGMRLLGYFICGLPCSLGFLYIFFNEEGLGLQDKIAGTEVIED